MPEHAQDEPARPEPHGETATGGRWRRFLGSARRAAAPIAEPANVVPVLLILALVARGVWIDLPRGGLIFDEAFYVNAARILLGWPVEAEAHYAGSPVGLDPNREHPPLGKLLIAASMAIFGDHGLGWRLPSILAGMGALIAFYLMARAAGASAWLATLALGFLAFDNLTLVHGRIGTLDMMALAPMLVGAWLALKNRWLLAGAAMAVGFLVKLTALYGLLALLLWLAVMAWDRWRADRRLPWELVRPSVALVSSFLVVGIGGLWLLDARFTTFDTPFAHIGHMVSYGASLTEDIDRSGICAGASSAPWQWPFNECQINYLRVDVTVTAGEQSSSVASIDFRGALNPLLAAAIPLATLMTVWMARRRTDTLARWALVWGAANYLPFLFLSLVSHRVTYIYYILPAVPALAIFTALLLVRGGLPRFILWSYVVLYAIGIAAYFPFRQIP